MFTGGSHPRRYYFTANVWRQNVWQNLLTSTIFESPRQGHGLMNSYVPVSLFVLSLVTTFSENWNINYFWYCKSGVLKRSKVVVPDFMGKLVFFPYLVKRTWKLNILYFFLKYYHLVILLIVQNVSSNNSWLSIAKPMSGKILTVKLWSKNLSINQDAVLFKLQHCTYLLRHEVEFYHVVRQLMPKQLFWKPSLNITYPYKLKMYLVISIEYSQAHAWMLKVIQEDETAAFVRVFR